MVRQTYIDQKMRQRENGFKSKTDQKPKIKGVKIAWVKTKLNKYPLFYIWYIIYQIDHRNKLNTISDAISKIEQKSQNRIPRELDQKFGIPRIVTIYWVSSTFFGNKKSLAEKS